MPPEPAWGLTYSHGASGNNRSAMSTPRVLVGLGVIATIVLVSLIVDSVTAASHPGGDPGGKVLNTMKGIKRAVPPGATDVNVRAYPTQWVSGCPDSRTPRIGWDKQTVYVDFSDHDPAAIVDREIASTLQRLGWSYSPMRITKGQGLVPHWLRGVSGSRPIDAFAFAVPDGSSVWFLSASWQPRPVGDGCP